MAFFTLGKDYIKDGYTQIDNIFLKSYLPQADPVDCKVYLYGLTLAAGGEHSENSMQTIAYALRLTEERIAEAYRYWEQLGLVSMSKTHPIRIVYHSVKAPLTPVIKINAREYSTFVEEVARLFPDKVLTPNEITAYIELMRMHKMEINAMLMIIRYCLDAKSTAGTPYILAVAADWAKQGITTEDAVNARIEELERNCEDVRAIFRTLGLKSEAALEDRQNYIKWTKEYKFQMDAILTAARSLKRRGGMGRLERLIEELKNAEIITAAEIAEYLKTKEENIALAAEIAKTLGTYYSSYDMIIETYLMPWQSKGFDSAALITVAKYCFLRNIRTLDGMNHTIDRFYRMGILTAEGVNSYIDQQAAIDNLIRDVLAAAGSSAFVTVRDREFYRTFVEVWGFDHNVIIVAANDAAGTVFPMAQINRTLARLKEHGITKPQEAKTFLEGEKKEKKNAPKPRSKAKEDYMQQTYDKKELSSLYLELDNINIDEEL
ncbi:MAG: DnaD domain protein [Clostridia bacterium]